MDRIGAPTRPRLLAPLLGTGLLGWALLAGAALLGAACAPEPGYDLPEIRERGTLRVAAPRLEAEARLPRAGDPLDREQELAEAFARDLGLEVEWVYVDGRDELLTALEEARADLAADNLTATPSRWERVAFSVPLAFTREVVVTRPGDEALRSPEDLEGRTIAVRPSSSFAERLEELRESWPGIRVADAPEDQGVHEILDQVASGAYDLTLTDENLARAALEYRDDVEIAFALEGEVAIAWALPPQTPKLRAAVDDFLLHTRADPADPQPETWAHDLPGLAKRGVLRVLTRNGPATYYVWRGELVGFEYELVREFARRHGLRVQMVVPPSREDLLAWLREGKGDLVAAGLTRSPERAEREEVAFSRRYHVVHETVVTRAGDDVHSVEDLAGRTVVVRRSASYWQTLERLRERTGIDFALEAAPETLETLQIIDRVAEGTYDLTVADDHLLGVARSWRDDVRGAFALGDPVEHGWAVRPENPRLLAAVDAFFRKEYRGTFYNVVRNRYFEPSDQVGERVETLAARSGRITPWDGLLRRHGREHGFDWRLIAAQMHQESRFDPEAHSSAGARGLMQILPRTAREFGGDEGLEDPATNIAVGVRYLAWLRERFPRDLPANERVWLALASYNAGYGHVRDARKLASSRGLDPDRWFGHVEQAMLLLRHPEVHRHTRFGYCRCGEPVKYVRAIRDRYGAYRRMASDREPPARYTPVERRRPS